MQSVPLKAVPNQKLSAILGAQLVDVSLYTMADGLLYMDVLLNSAAIVVGVICLNNTLIVRDTYFGFSGDLFITDTQGSSDPTYDGLGSRYVLVYSPSASATSAQTTSSSSTTPTTPAVSTDYVRKTYATGSAVLPVGPTADRDALAQAGYFRFNNTYNKPEVFNGSAWSGLGGASGGSGDDVFYENSQTITADYTITAGKNAMTTGPVTINSGVTVTIPTGSVWVIL